ncbi:MAG: small ribosomal subunit Rsm22 family protein [Caldilineaceae bacterium]
MQPTIIQLPPPIAKSINTVIARQNRAAWLERASALHTRYMAQAQDQQQVHVHDHLDAVAYLGLRAAATYAQIFGALAAVGEMLPTWQPQTMLDMGSGPGPALWTLPALLPSLRQITCVDQNTHFLNLGKRIIGEAEFPLTVTWQQSDILRSSTQDKTTYDLVLIANVFNELNTSQREKLLEAAFQRCRGVMLVLEPGTQIGSGIVQAAAQQLAQVGTLIAPYINSHFVEEHWLHFPQRFTRPDFARRIRQEMRASPLMASDWEEAKYSYVAVGRIPPEIQLWGRTIGPVELMNGYLELPILTEDQVLPLKVMKRHKQQYSFAKKVRWGELIMDSADLIFPQTA